MTVMRMTDTDQNRTENHAFPRQSTQIAALLAPKRDKIFDKCPKYNRMGPEPDPHRRRQLILCIWLQVHTNDMQPTSTTKSQMARGL